jgi:hypothetical protein
LFKVSFQFKVLASFHKIPSLNHVRYSRITSTKSPSYGITTFSASLRNLTAFKYQSHDNICYVSRRILATPAPPPTPDCRNQRKNSRNVLTCDISLASLNLPASEARVFFDLLLLFSSNFLSEQNTFLWLCPIFQPQIPLLQVQICRFSLILYECLVIGELSVLNSQLLNYLQHQNSSRVNL